MGLNCSKLGLKSILEKIIFFTTSIIWAITLACSIKIEFILLMKQKKWKFSSFFTYFLFYFHKLFRCIEISIQKIFGHHLQNSRRTELVCQKKINIICGYRFFAPYITYIIWVPEFCTLINLIALRLSFQNNKIPQLRPHNKILKSMDFSEGSSFSYSHSYCDAWLSCVSYTTTTHPPLFS